MDRMKRGDTVELRTPTEILATLDDDGNLDGMPFMSEMLDFFGGMFTVEARADRACDTIGYSGVRNPRNTVLLDDLRCHGRAHDGCQAQCRVYWKEAWLRPAVAQGPKAESREDPAYQELERRVTASSRAAASTVETPLFRCQATELLRASEPVGWWDPRSLVSELTGGNVGVRRFVRVMARVTVEEILRRLHLVQRTTRPFAPAEPAQPVVSPQPSGLRVGQLVQIRRGDEIRPTLDAGSKNKGLWFDREMKVYCGHTARVKARVERFIDEKSGRMIQLATDAYILDGVVCRSERSDGRWFCPRAIYPWWREAWLKPVTDAADDDA